MANKTAISWTDATWNIARGCTKVDEDCVFCYMMRDSLDGTRYSPTTVVRTKTVFNLPLKYKETKSKVWAGHPLIFTSSLTDWGHKDIDSYRHEMWDIIRRCPHLIFQMLTKRTERLPEILPPDWGHGYPNVWLGTSVGSQASTHRIHELLAVPASRHILSVEPMHGPLYIMDVLPQLDWVIIGGESGNENGKWLYRQCEMAWIVQLLEDCERTRVPAFVKQLGTYLSKLFELKDRHGADMDEWPMDLIRIREFPRP